MKRKKCSVGVGRKNRKANYTHGQRYNSEADMSSGCSQVLSEDDNIININNSHVEGCMGICRVNEIAFQITMQKVVSFYLFFSPL